MKVILLSSDAETEFLSFECDQVDYRADAEYINHEGVMYHRRFWEMRLAVYVRCEGIGVYRIADFSGRNVKVAQ